MEFSPKQGSVTTNKLCLLYLFQRWQNYYFNFPFRIVGSKLAVRFLSNGTYKFSTVFGFTTKHITSCSNGRITVGCARSSQIIANYFAPLSKALFGNTKSTKYLFVKAVFLTFVWWVTPQFSPSRFGVHR
jgi:hypothetical protein